MILILFALFFEDFIYCAGFIAMHATLASRDVVRNIKSLYLLFMMFEFHFFFLLFSFSHLYTRLTDLVIKLSLCLSLYL